MRIPRLIPLSIVVLLGTLPVLSQSMPTKAFSGPEFSPQSTPASPAFDWQEFTSPQGNQANLPALKYEAHPKSEILGAEKSSTCYSIRDYLFYRENSGSAAPKLKDYSTCEPASLFHERNAVESTK